MKSADHTSRSPLLLVRGERSMVSAMLERLACAACGSPVPLAVTETTSCPACQATVAIPVAHREARQATEQLLVGEGAARRWLDRAAHAPPALFTWLTFLEGGAFWGVVLPVVLPIAICLGTVLPPRLAEAFLHVRIVDTWADNQLAGLTIALPFVAVTIGLLLASFGRKRGLTVSALQAALAARSPEKGNTWSCRTCGAPLVVSSEASSARCDYCSADNLVKVPPERLEAVRSRRNQLSAAISTAEKDWRVLRADLRSSLFWRFVFGAGLIALVTVPILGTKPSVASPSTLDLSKASELPSFAEHRLHARTEPCRADRWTESAIGQPPCDEGCQFFALVSPLPRETIEVVGDALPVGTMVSLEPRRVGFADVRWAQGQRLTIDAPSQLLQFPVEVGGWYRLRLQVPGTAQGSIKRFCVRRAAK